MLDNQTLHTEIRERGGAYGSGSRQKSTNAVFSFYSYRDPHVGETLQTFEALKKLVKEGLEEKEREEAILEMLQGLDDPISPGQPRNDRLFLAKRRGGPLKLEKTIEKDC